MALLPSVVLKAAKIGLEDAIVPRVSVEVDNAHVLLQDGNVIQMSVGIAGLGNMPNIFLLWTWFYDSYAFESTCLDSIASPDQEGHYSQNHK